MGFPYTLVITSENSIYTQAINSEFPVQSGN